MLQISKLRLKEDQGPVQGSVGHRISELGTQIHARRGELFLKANWHPTLGNHCGYSELHFPDEGDMCKMTSQHDST